MDENYVDLLLNEISKAENREKLLLLEDDIEIARNLGQIAEKSDLRLLKLALQVRYSYIIFNEILGELEDLTNIGGSRQEKFKKEMENIQNRHLVLLEDKIQ